MVFSKKLDGVFAKIAGRAPWTRVLGPNICCDRAINPGLTYYKQLSLSVPFKKIDSKIERDVTDLWNCVCHI